jgi:hypothetical protein
VEQILGTFDRLERALRPGFRGCRSSTRSRTRREDRSVKKIAIAFKESRCLWFPICWCSSVSPIRKASTQLTLLVDGSIAQDLVRDDPSMARAAKDAARVLLKNAGIEV